MKLKKRFIFLVYFLSFLITGQIYSQVLSQEDINFKKGLQEFINENLARYGRDEIARERYLIQQMRDINEEIRSRVKNVGQVRDEYFKGLLRRLEELDALRMRLSNYNSAALNSYIDQLENRIRATLDEGEINYSRQKIFEDGIQVLYIAEEMLKLDPGSRLEGNPELRQQIQTSNRRLLNSFGDSRSTADLARYSPSGQVVTIWDLFLEWKRTNAFQYEARWTDIEIIKTRLIKNGTALEKERMFKRELRSALLAYNYRDYDLADRLLEEILRRYSFISILDDVFYYRGEANYQLDRYQMAEQVFSELVKKYPTSAYASKAYGRLVLIAHHFESPRLVDQYYTEFEKVAVAADLMTDEVRFTAALSAISRADFEAAVAILNNIFPASEFYIDARYLLAQAYAGSGNFEEAENVLLGIIRNYNTPPDYHFNVLLKLAYIKYENGLFTEAITYLDQIGGDFSLYDRVLIAYSWNYYKLELLKEEKNRNYDFAKKFLNVLMSEFPNSDSYLEAKTLLAYIYQMENETRSAIAQYEYVYQTSHTKRFSDSNLKTRDRLQENLYQVEEEMNTALKQNQEAVYRQSTGRYHDLQDSLMTISYSEFSPNSAALQNEISRIQDQIKELEKLRSDAVARNSPEIVERIDNLKDRLMDELEDARDSGTYSILGINYYDEHPHARKESLTEDQNQKILEMRAEAERQSQEIQKKLSEIERKMTQAKRSRDFKGLVLLEIKKDRYKDLLKKFDFFRTLVYDMKVSESEIDLEKWSNYGAFGIANVNFSVRENNKNKVAYYSEQINKINRILNTRKSLLDYKIGLIDGEINFMTRKVRRQERLRERAELDRKFEETYFDTHTSEFQQTETTPPAFEDEGEESQEQLEE